jgi:ankyrin repeat protein
MGWTPLHSSSYWNNYEIVNYLINMNANVNALTNSKQTALHLAASQRSSKETLIVLLLNKFIDYYSINDNHELACDIATRSCEHYRLFEITDSNLNQINY